jgi:hypothetical protein
VEALPLKMMVMALPGDGERLLQLGTDVGLPADELIMKFALSLRNMEEPAELTALTLTCACDDVIFAGMFQVAEVAGG